MKSFSGNVKSELASDTQKSKIKTCCAFSLIYGIMSFSRLKDGRLFLKTTNAEIKKLFSETCAFLSSKKKFFYEAKSGEISVDADFIKYSTFAEYNNFLFKFLRKITFSENFWNAAVTFAVAVFQKSINL